MSDVDPGALTQFGEFLLKAFGPGGFALAVVSGYLAWRDWHRSKEVREERAEWQRQLFGYTDKGTKVPGVMDRVETIRKEVWAAFDSWTQLSNEALKMLEERRRQDSIAHFAKQDDQLDEVKNMSQADMSHHARVEAKVSEVCGALTQMSARLTDMIALAARMMPAPWNGQQERRG